MYVYINFDEGVYLKKGYWLSESLWIYIFESEL